MGTGGWGIALAILLHNNGHQVTVVDLSAARSATCLHRERANEKLLPGVKIPDGIEITTRYVGRSGGRISSCWRCRRFAVASTAESLAGIAARAGIPVIVNVGKGLDAKHGYCRFSETIDARAGRQESGRCADRPDPRGGGLARHPDRDRRGVCIAARRRS